MLEQRQCCTALALAAADLFTEHAQLVAFLLGAGTERAASLPRRGVSLEELCMVQLQPQQIVEASR